MNLQMESVFYVDDNYSNLTLFREVFKNRYDIGTAVSPSKALKQIACNEYKVIILDYILPEMNGLDFIEQVKVHQPHTIFIILTAYPDLDVTVSAINQRKVFRFMIKPWKIADLDQALEDAFEAYYMAENNRILISELKEKNAVLETTVEQLEQENMSLLEQVATVESRKKPRKPGNDE